MDRPICILVVEDNEDWQDTAARAFAEMDPSPIVRWAVTMGEALDHLTDTSDGWGPDVVVLDLGLPDVGPGEVLPTMRAHLPETPIVVWTGADDFSDQGDPITRASSPKHAPDRLRALVTTMALLSPRRLAEGGIDLGQLVLIVRSAVSEVVADEVEPLREGQDVLREELKEVRALVAYLPKDAPMPSPPPMPLASVEPEPDPEPEPEKTHLHTQAIRTMMRPAVGLWDVLYRMQWTPNHVIILVALLVGGSTVTVMVTQRALDYTFPVQAQEAPAKPQPTPRPRSKAAIESGEGGEGGEGGEDTALRHPLP